MPKTIAKIAEELAAEIKLPENCRVDIQWQSDELIVSRCGVYGFAIFRQMIDDNTHVAAAKAGVALLDEVKDRGLIQKLVNVAGNYAGLDKFGPS